MEITQTSTPFNPDHATLEEVLDLVKRLFITKEPGFIHIRTMLSTTCALAAERLPPPTELSDMQTQIDFAKSVIALYTRMRAKFTKFDTKKLRQYKSDCHLNIVGGISAVPKNMCFRYRELSDKAGLAKMQTFASKIENEGIDIVTYNVGPKAKKPGRRIDLSHNLHVVGKISDIAKLTLVYGTPDFSFQALSKDTPDAEASEEEKEEKKEVEWVKDTKKKVGYWVLDGFVIHKPTGAAYASISKACKVSVLSISAMARAKKAKIPLYHVQEKKKKSKDVLLMKDIEKLNKKQNAEHKPKSTSGSKTDSEITKKSSKKKSKNETKEEEEQTEAEGNETEAEGEQTEGEKTEGEGNETEAEGEQTEAEGDKTEGEQTEGEGEEATKDEMGGIEEVDENSTDIIEPNDDQQAD